MDDPELPPLMDVLDRLPWFGDLTRQHRGELLAEVSDRLLVEGSREEFTALLVRWAAVAHSDAKWARLALLRHSGLLEQPRAA
ncbi:MAG: hypothetical protein EXR65_05535 [Dehalococcoidia bacterium]|nr:hypothetical protein [Dehalococcoidia bacterium]